MKQLEVGEERMQSCSDAAAQLIGSKNPQSSEVRETLHQLRYAQSVLTLDEVHSTSSLHYCLTFFFFPPLLCPLITFPSACWEELKVLARKRQQELQTAEKCHCFYQDLTEALILIEVLQPLIYQPLQVNTLSIVELLPLTTGATEEHS